MVRLVVDLNRCQGYAQCAFLAPEIFMMHGEEGLLYDPEPDEAQREKLHRAAAACPVQAILVEAPDTPDADAKEPAGAAGAPERGGVR